LRAAFLGEIADTLRIGQRDVEILVRQNERDRASLDDLADQTILLPDGRQVPLEVVAEVHDRRDWAMITRFDGKRTVSVQANVDARQASAQAIVNDVKANWLAEFEQRHPTVKVSFEGQVARSAETGGSIASGLLVGLLGVFVILSFQFRSYAEPLIVMLAIPLAFVGALWGHVLLGWYISMPSMIGAASLAGIVVNDSILLVQFIKEHRSKGLSVVVAGQSGQASGHSYYLHHYHRRVVALAGRNQRAVSGHQTSGDFGSVWPVGHYCVGTCDDSGGLCVVR
jgi:multidrug efflux pump subunit AcrB